VHFLLLVGGEAKGEDAPVVAHAAAALQEAVPFLLNSRGHSGNVQSFREHTQRTFSHSGDIHLGNTQSLGNIHPGNIHSFREH
jgi:hypothetical protein